MGQHPERTEDGNVEYPPEVVAAMHRRIAELEEQIARAKRQRDEYAAAARLFFDAAHPVDGDGQSDMPHIVRRPA